MLEGWSTCTAYDFWQILTQSLITYALFRLVVKIKNVECLGQRVFYQFKELFLGYAAQYVLGGTDRYGTDLRVVILAQAAPGIFSYRRSDARCYRVLVNVPQQGYKVGPIIHRFTLKSVLKHLTGVLIFVVKILSIGNSNTLDGRHYTLI